MTLEHSRISEATVPIALCKIALYQLRSLWVLRSCRYDTNTCEGRVFGDRDVIGWLTLRHVCADDCTDNRARTWTYLARRAINRAQSCVGQQS